MLKTFLTGIGGWADHQLPDGTVIWTAPTGRTYKTLPGSRIFFPDFNTTTAQLPTPTTPAPQPPGRALMMPKRRHTRAADRARRIRQQRERNAAWRAQFTQPATAEKPQTKPPPEEEPDFWDTQPKPDHDDGDPPPF